MGIKSGSAARSRSAFTAMIREIGREIQSPALARMLDALLASIVFKDEVTLLRSSDFAIDGEDFPDWEDHADEAVVVNGDADGLTLSDS